MRDLDENNKNGTLVRCKSVEGWCYPLTNNCQHKDEQILTVK